jgi:glycosyltransferase involved in cell wall biosynthesis
MRIGFIGNTNNYPFLIAQAMKDLGHEVRFVLDSNLPLHHPTSRCPDWRGAIPDWILDLSPMAVTDFRFNTEKRRKALVFIKECDAVFLNYWGPSLKQWIDVPVFAFLTGADLTYCANPETMTKLLIQVNQFPKGLRRIKDSWKLGTLIRRQRAGILGASAFCYQFPGLDPSGEAILDSMGMIGSRRVSVCITDTIRLQPCPPPGGRVRLQAVCGARLNWKHPFPETMSILDDKGIDSLVRGLGILKRRDALGMDLVLIRKGIHVRETAELVSSEGLDDHVIWRDELSQAELWEAYRQADIVFDQFGPASMGMAGVDALALGRPLVARFPEAQLRAVGATDSPVFQAGNPEAVAQQVERLIQDEGLRHSAGLASRQFAETYLSAHRAAVACLAALGIEGTP